MSAQVPLGDQVSARNGLTASRSQLLTDLRVERLYPLEKTGAVLRCEPAPSCDGTSLPLVHPAPRLHLGDRWPQSEQTWLEFKGADERTRRPGLQWSQRDFRHSFKKNAGWTLTAFLNSSASAPPSVVPTLVFGVYDRSHLIHGIWFDVEGGDLESTRLHVEDDLALLLRHEFESHYQPVAQRSHVLDAVRIRAVPVAEGLVGGRCVLVVMLALHWSGRPGFASEWKGRKLYRDGASTRAMQM